MPKAKRDIAVWRTQSFAMMRPETVRGRRWMGRHLRDAMSLGGATPVEYRYLEDIVLGARRGGLAIEAIDL